MRILLLIGAGSFIGGVLRFLISHLIQNKFYAAFPFGTLGVNIIGCFAIGMVVGFGEKANLAIEWRLFLATGICGGFTTFSAFSNETLGLMRDGESGYALLYVLTSVVLGLLSTFAGLSFLKLF